METKISTLPTVFGKCLGLSLEKDSLPVYSSKIGPRDEAKREAVLSFAKEHLPQKGVLKISSKGLVYVDVSDRYISELLPLLEDKKVEPPPYMGTEDFLGAHITALLIEENSEGLGAEELHQEIDFTITGCHKVEPENWHEMQEVWCLTVEVPQLEELRLSLSLSSHIQNQMFHITFGVQKRFLSLADILEERHEEILLKHISKSL